MTEMALRLLPEIGHLMRDILYEYHACIEKPYQPTAMYVKPIMHHSPSSFLLTPIHGRDEHQFVVHLDSSMQWIFTVIPF